MNTTDNEQHGQSLDPRLRRLTERYRKIMEGAPIRFPAGLAALYAPRRCTAARTPEGADSSPAERPSDG